MKSIMLLILTTFLLLHLTSSSSQPFDYPTATPGTKWTNSPKLNHTISYPDGATIRALLLKGNLGPSFAFGFFCTAPCASFLLSIYIVQTNSGSGITGVMNASPQVVWSANRDRPVGENATLTFSEDGDLTLLDSDGSRVWSTSTKSAASMSVNGIGELSLSSKSGAKLWSSADHPTDSLVLGQTLKQGACLTANVSGTNPGTGAAYLSVVDGGFRAFVGSNPNPPQLYYENVAAGNGVGVNSTRVKFGNGSLDVFVGSGSSPVVSVGLPVASSVQYMRLDYGGHLRLYEWSDGYRWRLVGDVISLFPDDCAYPTACGRYGICSSGQCTCPGKPYFRPVVERRPDFGCSLLRNVTCGSRRLLFLENVGYFGYSASTAADAQGISGEGCKRLCLKKCECKAAFFQYGGNALDGSCFLVPEVFTLIDNKPDVTHFNSSLQLHYHLRPDKIDAVAGAYSTLN